MKPERPDDETLALALRVVADVFTSPAVIDGLDLSITVNLTPHSGTMKFNNPNPRALRDLFVVIWKLDMPSHDARLTRVYPIIERVGVKPDWRDGLDEAKAMWAARNDLDPRIHVQEPGEIVADDADRRWIRPREAFELWVYGEVVHEDYAKEVKWRSLWLGQAMVRMLAHSYLNLLMAQASFVGQLIQYGLVGTPDPPNEESAPGNAAPDSR